MGSSRFRDVDDSYYRRKQFDFFSQYQDPRYHLSFELDMTELRQRARASSNSTYVSLCYWFTRALCHVEDFRYRLLDGRIVQYEQLHPRLLVTSDDRTFAEADLQYTEDEARFHAAAAETIEAARNHPGFTPDPEEQQNVVYFSALPGVRFTSLTHISENNPHHAVPKVTFGQYRESGSRWTIPVGLQVNHLFIDGNHLAQLVETAQRFFNGGEGSAGTGQS